jgi:hypothetical protein
MRLLVTEGLVVVRIDALMQVATRTPDAIISSTLALNVRAGPSSASSPSVFWADPKMNTSTSTPVSAERRLLRNAAIDPRLSDAPSPWNRWNSVFAISGTPS